MLILVEGTIHRPPENEELTAAQAWLGPMVDAGFLQNGYIDASRRRMWMVVSSPSLEVARHRLGALPMSQEGAVTFTATPVTAIRFR